MPNWADDEGRIWWTPPGKNWCESVEIPHAPLSIHKGCECQFCAYQRVNPPEHEPNVSDEDVERLLGMSSLGEFEMTMIGGCTCLHHSGKCPQHGDAGKEISSSEHLVLRLRQELDYYRDQFHDLRIRVDLGKLGDSEKMAIELVEARARIARHEAEIERLRGIHEAIQSLKMSPEAEGALLAVSMELEGAYYRAADKLRKYSRNWKRFAAEFLKQRNEARHELKAAQFDRKDTWTDGAREGLATGAVLLNREARINEKEGNQAIAEDERNMARRIRAINVDELWEAGREPEDDTEDDSTKVTCYFCRELVPANTAHRIEEGFVGDECCWDERLRQ